MEKIIKQIMSDPMNAQYTKQSIRPLFVAPLTAKILIIGQAPGIKAQETHKVFNDASGKRLREWMGINEEIFYESGLIAVVPMDFYYPGKGKSGDLPPRREFALKWHPLIINELKDVQLSLIVGRYAINHYIDKKLSVTDVVKNYRDYLPKLWPLVHPSPLNIRWISKNPWFTEDVIPALQTRVSEIIKK